MITRYCFFLIALTLCSSVSSQNKFDYQLQATEIAEDTYVLIGAKEDFSETNGGNIVNTGFIVTEKGVLVIDSGPSYLYGQQMRATIAEITDKPILQVVLTHHHPDHIFGNQAFDDVPIYALPDTVNQIQTQAEGFLDNLYRMVGYWMKGTEPNAEIHPLPTSEQALGKHQIKYLTFSGHTDSDLCVYDETTGVIFTGDLVFNNRAPTTPHAAPYIWQQNLDTLKEINFKTLVPGHGEIATTTAPIEQTQDYLNWLENSIATAVDEGKDMNEVLSLPIPERFQSLSVVNKEFIRSVTHRYPYYESKFFE